MRYSMVFFFLLLLGCSGKKDEPEREPHLVGVSLVGEYSRSVITEQAQALIGPQAGIISNFLRYDVRCYRVSYTTTTTDGREIVASGALVVPVGANSTSLVSIQHGTLFDEADAPSYFKPGTESLLGMVMASSGFLAALPDYVGYGESKAEPHPYEHAEGLALPVADFLLALKEHFAEEGIAWNRDILLAGYSAGGYATLAAQKLIEESYSSDLHIKATTCGAGAYYKSLLLDKFINEPSNGEVNHNRSYIWVMLTYNRIYGLNYPVSYFFREPYASRIEENGYRVTLSGSFNSLLNPDFITSYQAGNETKVTEAFRDNDLVNWKTEVSTLLVHGDADTYVPYVNSTAALAGMQAAGSRSVTLETVAGGTHESAVQDFIFKTYLKFAGYLTL